MCFFFSKFFYKFKFVLFFFTNTHTIYRNVKYNSIQLKSVAFSSLVLLRFFLRLAIFFSSFFWFMKYCIVFFFSIEKSTFILKWNVLCVFRSRCFGFPIPFQTNAKPANNNAWMERNKQLNFAYNTYENNK